MSNFQAQLMDARIAYSAKAINDAADGFGRNIAAMRGDADGMFAAELVREVSKQVHERKYPEFVWAAGELVSFDRGGHPGADSELWFEEDVYGEADWTGDMAEDLPVASVSLTPHVSTFARFGCKTVVTDADVDRWQLQGLSGNLPAKKAAAAKRMYLQKLNNVVLNGDTARGFEGMRSIAECLRFAAGTGSWLTANPEDIVEDFANAAMTIYNQSNTVYRPDTAVLPSTLMGRWSSTQNSIASDISLGKYMSDTFGQDAAFKITKWVFDPSMNTAGDDGGPAMLLYNRSSEFLVARLPVDFKPLRAKQEPAYVEQRYIGKYGGIQVYHPRSIALISGI